MTRAKCIIDGCERTNHAHGWCGAHYGQYLIYGDPLVDLRPGSFRDWHGLTETERFWSRVVRDPDTDCWLWLAAMTPEGYGQFACEPRRANGRLTQVGAHVYAFKLAGGVVPEGMQLDHLCRLPACVNPGHLEVVTPRTNTLRGRGPSAVNAAKTHCIRGHAFDAWNTYVDPKGSRQCRACQRLRRRRPAGVAR